MQLDNEILLKQVEELAKILKNWNEHLVIGGGVALVLYDLVLAKANAGAVGTTDIDFLIPRKPIKINAGQISDILLKNGFEIKNKSLDTPSVQSFVKQISKTEIEVEFLTDKKLRDKKDVIVINEAGLTAQGLSYIEMSLGEATPLTLPNKATILVVKPEAWVFHKGLTFPKRTNAIKKYKDLYGIWFTLTQLNETSIATKKSLLPLLKRHSPAWANTFKKNLLDWIENASPKDWSMLERQDVNGKLTKVGFVEMLNSLKF